MPDLDPWSGLTLTAFYGAKPEVLCEHLGNLLGSLRARMGAAFEPYATEQIHMTLCGVKEPSTSEEQMPSHLDLHGLLLHLMQSPALPMEFQIAGYGDVEEPAFQSRGLSPYLRSLTLAPGDALLAMGWPAEERRGALNQLRRSLEPFGVHHKYLRSPGDYDDDLFFVLGHMDLTRLSTETVEKALCELRTELAEQSPLRINLTRAHLSLVSYKDPRLPRCECTSWSLEEAQARLAEGSEGGS